MSSNQDIIRYSSLSLDDRNNVINPDDTGPDQVTYTQTDGEWTQSIHRKTPIKSESDPPSNSLRFDLWSIFRSVFLPIGYPESVTADYGVFQICDTIQALSSYLRGLLTTRSTLIAIGVGRSTADATSAVTQFIFRDLSGLVGSVLFSWRYSYSFGLEIKHWRLFADVINDIALCLELFSPLFPAVCFVPILCSASICKALCGCSAGATRVAIAKHFSKHNDNETDIVSKEGIQETFVTVLGMICGLILTRSLHQNDHQFGIVVAVFAVLTAVHVVANYYAVKSLELTTLNLQRMDIVTRHWIESKSKEIISPKAVCERESVVNLDLFPFNLCTPYLCRQQHVEAVPGVKIEEISPIWMRWNLQSPIKSRKYRFAVSRNRVLIAYDLKAVDIDFVESFLVYQSIRKWILTANAASSAPLEPNDLLNIPFTKEIDDFGKRLSDSPWIVAHLRQSLGIQKNRYQVG